jgi:heptosyltransferase-3
VRRLIIRPGAIGDFIVSLPALHHLRTAYTELWTTESNLPLVPAEFDAKRSIISAGLDRVGVLPADDVLARLRQFDDIVSWYGSNRPDFRALVKATFHPALPTGIHAVDFYCTQVGAPLGAIPRLDLGPVRHHGSIVLHPFASSPAKRWPHALSLHLPNLVHLRGPEEQLAGALFIPDLADLARYIAGARAYIGNDSGITHLAAALGVPTIAIFQSTDPAIWGPRGTHVRILQQPTPDAVLDALHDFGIY